MRLGFGIVLAALSLAISCGGQSVQSVEEEEASIREESVSIEQSIAELRAERQSAESASRQAEIQAELEDLENERRANEAKQRAVEARATEEAAQAEEVVREQIRSCLEGNDTVVQAINERITKGTAIEGNIDDAQVFEEKLSGVFRATPAGNGWVINISVPGRGRLWSTGNMVDAWIRVSIHVSEECATSIEAITYTANR